MLEMEKQAKQITTDEAISETLTEIAKGVADLNLNFDIKEKLTAALSGNRNNAPHEIKEALDSIHRELIKPSEEQIHILKEYTHASNEISNAKRALKIVEMQERTLISDIQYVSADLKRQEEVLAKLPNPKMPSNFIAKLFDTKQKQAQRANYAKLYAVFAATSQSLERMKDNLQPLNEKRETHIAFIQEHKQSLADIAKKRNDVLAMLGDAKKVGNTLREVARSAILNLSKSLNVQDPFSHGEVTWHSR